MRSLRTLVNRPPVPYVAKSAAHVSTMFDPDAPQIDHKHMMGMYGAVSTLFAVVSATSTSTARVKWRLWRTTANGDRVEVVNHPALVVWNKPNRFYTGQELVESIQQHIDLTGEGWLVVYRDPRMPAAGPTELWPIRPDRIRPVKSPTEFLTGYVYTSPDGENVPLNTADVIQIRMPNPMDPYRGLGPVQSMLSMLQGQRSAMDYNRNFFTNGAGPGGIIEFPDVMDDDEFNQFKRRWAANHQGVANAHKVATLEGGAKWVDRNYTYKDMQFTELAAVTRDMIREAFLVHKHILGQSDGVNRANAVAADDSFAERVVIPRLDRFKAALNNDFLPLFPGAVGLEFDYEDPHPKDVDATNAERASKTSAFKTLVDAGVDPGSAAETVGLDPMRMLEVAGNETPVQGS